MQQARVGVSVMWPVLWLARSIPPTLPPPAQLQPAPTRHRPIPPAPVAHR